MKTEELERLDARKAALDLILNSESTCVTPYGVVYDNDMKLEHHYRWQYLPAHYSVRPAQHWWWVFSRRMRRRDQARPHG